MNKTEMSVLMVGYNGANNTGAETRRFQTANAEGLLGPCTLDWRAVLPSLLAYAASRGFLHASGRTAHEQVLCRLRSRSRPVRHLPAGAARSLLRPPVRSALLRRAGPDRCAQLISGSAPASPTLLAAAEQPFRDGWPGHLDNGSLVLDGRR